MSTVADIREEKRKRLLEKLEKKYARQFPTESKLDGAEIKQDFPFQNQNFKAIDSLEARNFKKESISSSITYHNIRRIEKVKVK